MPHALAQAVEALTSALTLAGMGYLFAAMLAAYVFLSRPRHEASGFTPSVSILKSLKGLDPGMLDAFRSHCRQEYAGEFEMLFGVSSMDDPAAAAVLDLQREFPGVPIRLIECPQRLGTNGKVSTLAQLVPHARHPYLLVNDSDITVSPRYLARVMGEMQGPGTRRQGPGKQGAGNRTRQQRPVGLVTALYRGRPHGTVWSSLESLGIATEFHPGVLVSRWMEGGLRYGLGSTLAMSREALGKIGGFECLVDHLADDYELGARIYAAGYAVALSSEVVETSVPAYTLRGFLEHQVRWYRTVRDARPAGYPGLLLTYGIGWALLNVVASGISWLSLWLFGLAFFLRLTMAMTVGARVLHDRSVLANLWLVPLRDMLSMALWVAGLAGHTIVWRGEQFVVKDGRLSAPAGLDSRQSRAGR